MLPAAGLIGARARAVGGVVAGLLLLAGMTPHAAQAHGATDPVASSYLARVNSVPAGMTARVVDGDLRLWLHVSKGKTVVVLDYQGAPYLRFEDGRVWANENSEMFYYNQTPPADPPLGLRRLAPEHWLQVGSGTSYQWHDGRLHAFALQAVAPGAARVGPWRIPILVNGRRSALTGTLWYRGGPSLVWLWPIAILVLCVLAGWRLHERWIDALLARVLAGLTLFGISLAATGRDLHGRPGISIVGVVELAFILAFTAMTAWRVLRGRAGALSFFVIALAGIWEAISLIPTLFNGYVLLAVPPFVGRLATIICLGGPIALAWPAVRVFRHEQADEPDQLSGDEVVSAAA